MLDIFACTLLFADAPPYLAAVPAVLDVEGLFKIEVDFFAVEDLFPIEPGALAVEGRPPELRAVDLGYVLPGNAACAPS